MKKPIFTRPRPIRGKNYLDSKGIVHIQITRRDKGKYVKGNITKTVLIDNTKVSDVARALEKWFFK